MKRIKVEVAKYTKNASFMICRFNIFISKKFYSSFMDFPHPKAALKPSTS